MTRPHFKTKAEWAAARVRELDDQIARAPTIFDRRGVSTRDILRSAGALQAERDRFSRMAQKFARMGV